VLKLFPEANETKQTTIWQQN